MKKIVCTIITVLLCFGSFAQRYEVWVNTNSNHKMIKGSYGFSNDTILMTFSKASLIFPSKDSYFTWDDVTDLKVRNKSKNQLGQLIGAGVGILASSMIYNSIKESSGDKDIAGIYMIVFAPIFIGTGTLIGHLATSKKTKIPLHGFNSEEKNQLLKSSIKRKD